MKKISPFYDFILGSLYLIITGLVYIPLISAENIVLLGDWAFVTGCMAGLFYITSGVIEYKNEELPCFLHLYQTSLLAIVFIGTFTINIKWSFFLSILRIVLPLFALFRFYLFCDCRKIHLCACVLGLSGFAAVYFMFTYALYSMIGECPEPARYILESDNIVVLLLITILLAISVILVGYVLLYTNRYSFRKRDKKQMEE